MKEKKATVMDNVRPDLFVPPHLVGELLHLLVGEWYPDPSQQEQLIAHLTECPYCRTALIVLLSAQQDVDSLSNDSQTPAHDLFTKFATIHREVEAHTHESIGAYAEAIVAEGKEKADKHFPILLEHIQRCPDCKATLEATLAFLNEFE